MRSLFRPWPGVLSALLLTLGILGCQPKELTSAKIYIQQNRWARAVEQLETAVELYPENAEAHFLLGLAYGYQNRFQDMNHHFDRAAQLDPEYQPQVTAERERLWTNHYDLGLRALKANALNRAEAMFKTAVIIQPNETEAHRSLAQLYLKKNQPDKSIAIYKNLLKEKPDDLELLIALGNLYYSLNRYREAAAILERVVQLDEDHPEILANLALSYDSLGEVEAAARAYEQAITANPEDQDLIFLFGVHKYKRGAYDEAIGLFKRVLHLAPDDFEATVNIANAYLSMAEREKEKFNDIEYNDHVAEQIRQAKERTILYYQKAIPYLERALELQPHHPKLWMNLGIAYINTGQKEKGEAALLRSEELRVNLTR